MSGEDDLEDLLTLLKSQIDSSDFLAKNPATGPSFHEIARQEEERVKEEKQRAEKEKEKEEEKGKVVQDDHKSQTKQHQ
jgi:hypothetical protein